MSTLLRIGSFAMALVVLPVVQFELCGYMRDRQIPRPPRGSFFLLLGTAAGWLIACSLAPSGLAALCMVPLLTVAPVALLASAVRLNLQKERTAFHRWAMISGYAYAALVASAACFSIFQT